MQEFKPINDNYRRLLTQSLRDYAIMLLDPGGYVQFCSAGVAEIQRYAPREIEGLHFSMLYVREDIINGRPAHELKIAEQTGRYEGEGWRLRKDGSRFRAKVVITPLLDEYNVLAGFSIVTRDITERKAKDLALRESEGRYRLLVEQVKDYAIFMLDQTGRIISWNEGAERIKGYTADEILGKHFSIFFPKEDIAAGKADFELEIACKEGKYSEEGWRIRKNGSRFWGSILITAVYNEYGNLVGFSKVTRDLTERKTSELALKESEERYRRLVEKLNRSNMELEFANKELEQFNSIVSHDLQEPLRTIHSFLQLIEMRLGDKKDPEVKTYINKAVKGAIRMKGLITSLLDYSQLDKNQQFDTISVDEMIGEVLQDMKAAIDSASAVTRTENKIRSVKGDRAQLQRLIQNLVGNALKFKTTGTPVVIIRAEEREEDYLFSVTDNGIGIPEEHREDVFEIFRMLHSGKKYQGNGIGLAICKKIVKRHRGRIWVESQPGKGATFYFTIHKF